MECAICNVEMKKYQTNNPQPLLDNLDDRVCRDCNTFVTATRIILRGLDAEQYYSYGRMIGNILKMGYGLQRANKEVDKRVQWVKTFEEE